MKMRRTLLLGILLLCIAFTNACHGVGRSAQNHPPVKHSPKNVIIMIADGGGFNHYASAGFYQCGQIPCQSYEDFPVRLAMSTYPIGGSYDSNTIWTNFDYLKNDPTDSAAAATAMATGIKTYNAAIGVDNDKNPVTNLVERAEQLGKSTGVVTSVPFNHATPAGFVAHNDSRDDYKAIADEMINKSAADVIMGCGHPLYNANGNLGALPNYKYIRSSVWAALKTGSAGADADGDGSQDPWSLIQTREQFQALASGPAPKRVFGLAQVYETLQEKRSGNADAIPYEAPMIKTVPMLDEMTRAALNVLDDDPDGFFVMIEGGAVDWAAHDNHSGRMVEEMIDFNKAVEAVLSWIEQNSSWGDTLVIITADHETGYLTGPDSGQKLFSDKPVWNQLIGNGAGNPPSMQWHSGGHTNSLVPFFAKGRGVQMFKDTIDGDDPVRGPYIDNTDIANVIFSLWRD